jgi:hypothetical protein
MTRQTASVQGVGHAGAVEVFVQLRSAPQPAYDATKVSAKVLA